MSPKDPSVLIIGSLHFYLKAFLGFWVFPEVLPGMTMGPKWGIQKAPAAWR